MTRYDLLLAIIPLAFLTAIGISSLIDIPTRQALTGAAVIGGLAVADGLFLNPPTRPGSGQTSY